MRHALATTSCTTALHLALAALGVGPGDEVIVPAFTWVATANAVLYCGATPVLCDVSPITFNIDPSDVASKLTERTKAIIPVHLFGLCADIDALRAAIPSHVKIVEDAACAAGAAYKGVPAGGLGDIACFSFHPRKSITTGEGGMMTTNDATVAARAEVLRNHGAAVSEEQRHLGPQPYLLPAFDDLGFNYRMTDVQAAIGVVQLRKLDRFIDERDRWARFYRDQLGDIAWLRHPESPERGAACMAGLCDDRGSIDRADTAQRYHGPSARGRRGDAARYACRAYARILCTAFRALAGRLPGRSRLRGQHAWRSHCTTA